MGIIDWIKGRSRTGLKSQRKGLVKDSRPIIANYNDSIKRGLRRAGIPRHRDFDVLKWCIGSDFYDLSIEHWPGRAKERMSMEILLSDTITSTVYKMAVVWLKYHNV